MKAFEDTDLQDNQPLKETVIPQKRHFGQGKGAINISDDFDRKDEEILSMFYEGEIDPDIS